MVMKGEFQELQTRRGFCPRLGLQEGGRQKARPLAALSLHPLNHIATAPVCCCAAHVEGYGEGATTMIVAGSSAGHPSFRFVVDEPPRLGGKGIGELALCAELLDVAGEVKIIGVRQLSVRRPCRSQPAVPAAGLARGLHPVHRFYDRQGNEVGQRGQCGLVVGR